MKKEERTNAFSWSRKYYILAFFFILIIILIFYYFFFNFKTGDLVHKKNFNMLGEVTGTSPLKLGYLVYWQNGTYTNEFAFNLEKVDQIEADAFDQTDTDNKTPIFIFQNSFENNTFSKTLLNQLSKEKIDNMGGVYGQIPQIITTGICIPNLKCEAWSDCQVNYNIESLINPDKIEGLEYKYCTDMNKCIPDIVGSRVCISKVNITLDNDFWCGKEYIKVMDNNGKVLARLDTNNQPNYLDININLGGDYCYYCHDNKIDYDETGIDCGGSCNACLITKQKV